MKSIFQIFLFFALSVTLSFAQECIDYNMIDSTAACTTEYIPVCGCDGYTYGNACEAQYWYGVTAWTEGSCQTDTVGCNLILEIYPDSTTTGEILIANISGGTPPYLYTWDNGTSNPNLVVNADGTYCIEVVDAADCFAFACIDIGGNTNPTDTTCYVWIDFIPLDSVGVTLLSAYGDGEAPFSYQWSDGQTTSDITVQGDGTYCVSLVDATGCISVACAEVNSNNGGGGDNCYDPWAINLGADCPDVYEPVCGCDGITYENVCYAENCFGIIEWIAGPCANGGTGNGTSTDSLWWCNASFAYTIEATSDTEVTVSFDADSDGNTPEYYWEFGNGDTVFGETATTIVALQDSFTILSACVYMTDIDSCFAVACETIIIDTDPDGFINGTIAESDNLLGDSDVSRGSGNGDPLANIAVLLLNNTGTEIATTLTNENGFYGFENLFFGNYSIKIDIEGIKHDPFAVKLSPLAQQVQALDFEVSETNVETTTTQEVESIGGFKIFPNPVVNDLQIEFSASEQEAIQVNIYDVRGQLVQEQKVLMQLGLQTITMPTANFSDGLYLLSLQTKDGVISRRFVK